MAITVMACVNELPIGVVLALAVCGCCCWVIDRKHEFQVCSFDDNEELLKLLQKVSC